MRAKGRRVAIVTMTIGLITLIVFPVALFLRVGIPPLNAPYPLRVWWLSKKNTRYSAEWQISKEDYSTIMQLVERELHSPEIPTRILIKGPNEVLISTIERWQGPLAARGRGFILKKIEGKWRISERTYWVS